MNLTQGDLDFFLKKRFIAKNFQYTVISEVGYSLKTVEIERWIDKQAKQTRKNRF